MWMPGNTAAMMTAKMVIASAERLMAMRHFWRKSKSTAEINVPAWPMPTHHTKLVMSQAQSTVLFNPHVPMPVPRRYKMHPTPYTAMRLEMVIMIFHPKGAGPMIGPTTSSVMSL